MVIILDVLKVLIVFKVYICDSWWVLNRLRIVYAIFKFSNWESFELHDILCQCSSLIAEDLMHHAELFVKIWTLHYGTQSCLLITDWNVNWYEVCLRDVDHFKGDEKWYGYEIHERDEPDASLLRYHDRQAWFSCNAKRIDVPKFISIEIGPERGDHSRTKTHNQLNEHGN